MQRAAHAYLETQVTTTSQGQLLIMLYDGAIKFMVQAKASMAVKDYGAKGNLISKAIAVIDELDSSLNVEKGGDLAVNLHQLYFYCTKRLFTANCKMDPKPIDEVIKILGGLRSAYKEIIGKPEAVAAVQTSPPRQGTSSPNRVLNMPGNGTYLTGQGAALRAKGMYARQGAQRMPPPVSPVAEETPTELPEYAPNAFSPMQEAGAPMETTDTPDGAQSPPSLAAPSVKRFAAAALYGKFSSLN
jgi:flagellar protein FliS